MKIVHLNTYDTGGAANSCIRLHKGLLENNIDSKLIVKTKTKNIPECFKFTESQDSSLNRLKKRINSVSSSLFFNNKTNQFSKSFIQTRDKRLELFSYPTSKLDFSKFSFLNDSDIINLHWVADFINWDIFFCQNFKNIVWTLHDQNPFLGGEHYSERFLGINDAGNPIMRQYQKNEQIEANKILEFKKRKLDKIKNLHIVSPSKWLLESSQKSEIFNRFPHYHIPYGFPTNIFKPYEKNFCRDLLNIPKDKFVILFVADSIENSRKGYIYLQMMLSGLPNYNNSDIFLCSIGSGTAELLFENSLQLGKLTDERLMATAYSAADVFIIPSLEDNLPNTMIESLLCGTPVIGFPTGGIPETIIDGYNGYVCKDIGVSYLKEALELFIKNKYNFDKRKFSAEAAKKFSLSVQANSYKELYNQILNDQ